MISLSSNSIHHTRGISWRELLHFSKSARVCSSPRQISFVSIDGYTRCANLNPLTSNHCRNNRSWRSRRRFSSKPIEMASRMDNQTAYGLLKLAKFDQSEIDFRFDQILQAGGSQRQRGDSCDDSIHSVENKTQKSQYEPQQLSAESLMRQSDIEAYLLQRYIQIEDEWHVKRVAEDNFGVIYAENQQKHEQSTRTRIQECARIDAASIFHLLSSNIQSTDDATTSLTKHQFYSSISNSASQIHYPTILPLAASMLLVGSSVGVISPIMPFLATTLDLTTSQYGIVVSSFALSKMLGNVPSAILVERHGRKPYLVHSLWLVGLGVAGLGLSSTWMELSICRMTIGLGVAALTTASTLTATDVSTPLSRASSFSPVMSAFAAGAALGPAVGGLLCDEFGIRDTFLIVASSYGVVGAWNRVSLTETGNKGFWVEGATKLPWHEDINGNTTKGGDADMTESKMTTTVSRALQETFDQWSCLINDRKVRPLVIMNGFYMMAISGTQMTLLPLLLTNGGPNSTATGIALTASAMGYCYAWMSAVAVVGNPAAGRFADKAGKQTAIFAGGILTGAAMASVPTLCAYGLMAGDIVSLDPNDVNWPLLATALGAWSLGSALLGTSHVAAISDAVSDLKRPQALALLRSGGDVGFLCGAISAGVSADLIGDVGVAMQLGSAVFMGATGWFGLQALALHKLEQNVKKKE